MPDEDFLEAMLAKFPPPTDNTSFNGLLRSPVCRQAIDSFLQETRDIKHSNDPRTKFLLSLKPLHHENVYSFYLKRIVELAITDVTIPDDESATAQFFRLFRWLAQGRKDGDSPFIPPKERSTFPVDHTWLPENSDSDKCAVCGEAAKDACHGCRIVHSNGLTYFPVRYCGPDCRHSDLMSHKESCSALRRFYVATDMFCGVLDQFLSHTFTPLREIIASNTGRYPGMNHVECISRTKQMEYGMLGASSVSNMRFQHGGALHTTFGGLAVVFGLSASDQRAIWRLFEILVLPTCSDISTVSCTLRNMENPLCITTAGGESVMEFAALQTHDIAMLDVMGKYRFVFNPSSPMFGWKDFIAPAKHFANHRIHSEVQGEHRMASFALSPPSPNFSLGYQRRAAADLALVINLHFERRYPGRGVMGLLSLEYGLLLAAKRALMSEVRSAMKLIQCEMRSEPERENGYRLYVSELQEVCVVDSPDSDLFKRLKNVWVPQAALADPDLDVKREYWKRWNEVMTEAKVDFV
ncbi:hypothetical protein QBC39DRAFT_397197 [Podospora conica]|nr:hypothetical protein QBC39DRAFT_397197 [Schizothecium conicum]